MWYKVKINAKVFQRQNKCHYAIGEDLKCPLWMGYGTNPLSLSRLLRLYMLMSVPRY